MEMSNVVELAKPTEPMVIPSADSQIWDLVADQPSPERHVRVYQSFECPTIRKVVMRDNAPGTSFGVKILSHYETFGQQFPTFEEAYGHSMKHEVWGFACLFERYEGTVMKRQMIRMRAPDFDGAMLTANWKDNPGDLQQEINRMTSEMVEIIAKKVNEMRSAGKDMPTPTPLSEIKPLPGAMEMNRGLIFTSVPKKEH